MSSRYKVVEIESFSLRTPFLHKKRCYFLVASEIGVLFFVSEQQFIQKEENR